MNWDLLVILGYLVLTLFVGIYYGRGVNTVRDFAIGDRNFSTSTLVMTLAATWISGSAVMSSISETYQVGIIDGLAYFGNVIATLVIAAFFAPRMFSFFNMISVGDMMEKIYGKEARIISGISGFILTFGFLAGQIKAMSLFFNYFFHVNILYTTVLCTAIIIAYSAYGGIKSVTFTDVIQFLTLVIALPMLLNIVLNLTNGYESVIESLPPSYLSLPTDPKQFNKYLFLFLFFLIPILNPANVQRMLMAKNTVQLQESFIWLSLIKVLFIILVTVVGLIAYSINSNANANQVFMYIIDTYMPVGVKGIMMIGMIAIIMSTADSHINAGSVCLVHDFIAPLSKKQISDKNQLFLLKLTTILGGVFAIILALKFKDILNLVLFAQSFYAPLVSIPLAVGIMGFRTEKVSYILSVCSSAIVIMIWSIFNLEFILGYKALVPSMLTSAVVLIISHYILGLEGGWDGNKGNPVLEANRISRAAKVQGVKNFFRMLPADIRNFSFNRFALNRCGDISPYIYPLAIFTITTSLVPYFIRDIGEFSYISMYMRLIGIGLCTILLFYSERVKNLPSLFYLAAWYNIAFLPVFLSMGSAYSLVWILNLVLGVVLLAIIVDWISLLVFSISSFTLSYYLHTALNHHISTQGYSPYWSIYALGFIGFIGILFSRPKQYMQALIVKKKEYIEKVNAQLEQQIEHKFESIDKMRNLRAEILRNISHEVKTPMMNVSSTAELLYTLWSSIKGDEEKVKKLIDMNYQGSIRLEKYVGNLIDLSQYNESRLKLLIEKGNIVTLVKDIIIEFTAYAESLNLSIKCYAEMETPLIDMDVFRMSQVFNNLIANAIKFTKEGVIEIDIRKHDLYDLNKDRVPAILISVKDNGVGIPEEELKLIFEEFTQSSRTKNYSGGKGLGLAIAHNIVRLHEGKIWAENQEIGSQINILLPIIHPDPKFLGRRTYVTEDNDTIANVHKEIIELRSQVEHNKLAIKSNYVRVVEKQGILTVLIVDDEELVIQSASMIFETLECNILSAVGGLEAIDLVKSKKYKIDVVFLDFMMPDINGEEVFKIIRPLLPPTTKIIIQSGLKEDELKDIVKRLGADGYITKPYGIIKVKELMKNIGL